VTTLLDPSRAPHKYKQVKDAANDVGFLPRFNNENKVLSKLVHPTALSIQMLRKIKTDEIRKQIVDSGDATAREALERLESSDIGDIYRKYKMTMLDMNAKLPKDKKIL
jgi:hypothetical protein